jgi:hypothetical protein
MKCLHKPIEEFPRGTWKPCSCVGESGYFLHEKFTQAYWRTPYGDVKTMFLCGWIRLIVAHCKKRLLDLLDQKEMLLSLMCKGVFLVLELGKSIYKIYWDKISKNMNSKHKNRSSICKGFWFAYMLQMWID